MAKASAMPSKVEVPVSDLVHEDEALRVAWWRMAAARSFLTMKVERPKPGRRRRRCG